MVNSFEQTNINSAATANLTTITSNNYINVHNYYAAKPTHQFYTTNAVVTYNMYKLRLVMINRQFVQHW